MAWIIGILVVFIAALVFYRLWKPLGGALAGARLQRALRSPHYYGKKFINLTETAMHMDVRELASMIREHFMGAKNIRPRAVLEHVRPDITAFLASRKTQIIWLGHSTFLIRIGGKTLLLDPVFSKRASPFQSMGPKRFAGSLPLSLADVPNVDAVVISHDHYDHLDYASIRGLRTKAGMFFVPLGVGAHLERWGVAGSKVTELDWWQEAKLDDITLACTPSRHFSGRRFGDHCATLWGSWVLMHGAERLFFSGDTGYGAHFAEIGKRYGPFDATLMECGQYDPRWINIHMLPEQTVQAAADLRSKLLVPIHWGAFALAFHSWTDSVTRAVAAAKKIDLSVATPRLGERMLLEKPTLTRWWLDAS